MVRRRRKKWWWFNEILLPELKISKISTGLGIIIPKKVEEKFKLNYNKEYLVFFFKQLAESKKRLNICLGSVKPIKVSSTHLGFRIPKSKESKFQVGEVIQPLLLKRNYLTVKEIREVLKRKLTDEELEVEALRLIEEAGLNLK